MDKLRVENLNIRLSSKKPEDIYYYEERVEDIELNGVIEIENSKQDIIKFIEMNTGEFIDNFDLFQDKECIIIYYYKNRLSSEGYEEDKNTYCYQFTLKLV